MVENRASHSDANRFGRNTDNILFYSKSDKFKFEHQYTEHSEEYIKDLAKN